MTRVWKINSLSAWHGSLNSVWGKLLSVQAYLVKQTPWHFRSLLSFILTFLGSEEECTCMTKQSHEEFVKKAHPLWLLCGDHACFIPNLVEHFSLQYQFLQSQALLRESNKSHCSYLWFIRTLLCTWQTLEVGELNTRGERWMRREWNEQERMKSLCGGIILSTWLLFAAESFEVFDAGTNLWSIR